MSVKSPCRLVCKYNENNICVGCYRTMEEITEWVDYSDIQKLQVWQKIRERKRSK